jgi:CRISPR-associated protein Cas5d
MKNQVDFMVQGRYALFSDPLTRMGGEKCSYHLPTYEALKGIIKSVYWKPTFVWVIDRARVMRPIRTESKGMKPINYDGIYHTKRDHEKKQVPFNDLSIYTYLCDVEYQVQAHFEWNQCYPEMEKDRVDGKHFAIAKRMIERGGRRDIFLGTRECQGYVESCAFGDGAGAYDGAAELQYGLMFHGFDYPDETGKDELWTRFWKPSLKDGIIEFTRPEDCAVRKFVREQRMQKPLSCGLNEEGLYDGLD